MGIVLCILVISTVTESPVKLLLTRMQSGDILNTSSHNGSDLFRDTVQQLCWIPQWQYMFLWILQLNKQDDNHISDTMRPVCKLSTKKWCCLAYSYHQPENEHLVLHKAWQTCVSHPWSLQVPSHSKQEPKSLLAILCLYRYTDETVAIRSPSHSSLIWVSQLEVYDHLPFLIDTNHE